MHLIKYEVSNTRWFQYTNMTHTEENSSPNLYNHDHIDFALAWKLNTQTLISKKRYGCRCNIRDIQLFTYRDNTFIAVLHFTVTVVSSIISITHTMKL